MLIYFNVDILTNESGRLQKKKKTDQEEILTNHERNWNCACNRCTKLKLVSLSSYDVLRRVKFISKKS